MGSSFIETALANVSHPFDDIVVTVVELWLKYLDREEGESLIHSL